MEIHFPKFELRFSISLFGCRAVFGFQFGSIFFSVHHVLR